MLARLQKNPALTVLATGGAAVVLLVLSVIGALVVGGDDGGGGADSDRQDVAAGPSSDDPNYDPNVPGAGTDPNAPVAPGTDPNAPGGAAGGGTGGTGGGGGGGGGRTPGRTTDTLPSQPGATRIGVGKDFVKWGLHAPKQFGTIPVNFAEDPLEGVEIYTNYINERLGGINGRKIQPHVEDDRYEVEGAARAANNLVNSVKPFFISGTLGVDQVAIVAAEAKKAKIPYIAGGGSEKLFKDIGMFQVAGSYDTHLIKLAQFLAKESAKPPCTAIPCAANTSVYSGMKRVAVSTLDTKYIIESVNVFKDELAKNGMQFVGYVTVKKPTDQTSYRNEILQLKGMANGQGPQILVPAQDPLTTSRMVAECQSQQCPWTYSISNFAHDSDVALALMQASVNPNNPSRRAWAGVRGLSGGCYYRVGQPSEGNPNLCGQLAQAHTRWVAMKGEDDWVKDGQGGTAGYQLVHIWVKALADTGADPTRERFLGALNNYENYADLVSGPITYKNSPNKAHGIEKMVIYEADNSDKWRQVGPGFVDNF